MKFGIKTNPQETTWPDLLAMWRRADAIEAIESAWVFDHFYPIQSDPNGPCMEGWTVLSALAHDTQRLRVGSMVNGMPYRHPAVTANMAAAVDIISEGRLELGLGAGWYELEADAYGIDLGASVGERMDMFDEGVEAVVGLLSQEETTLAGKHVQLTNARNEPKGPQRPHPPIVIGGKGEKRTLRTVARWADHWNTTRLLPEEWAHKRSVLEQHCAVVGRDYSQILRSMVFRFDPDDIDELRDRIEMFGELGVQKAVIKMQTPHETRHVDLIGDLAESMA